MLQLLQLVNFNTYHSSGGVDNFHLLEDSGTIVGDDNSSLGVLDLFNESKVRLLNY